MEFYVEFRYLYVNQATRDKTSQSVFNGKISGSPLLQLSTNICKELG